MTRRREFLKAAGVGALRPNQPEPMRRRLCVIAVTAARDIVRRGELGAIHFCRIADPGLREAASYILDGAECVIEIEPGTAGTTFLGSRGTLVASGGGCRVFSQAS